MRTRIDRGMETDDIVRELRAKNLDDVVRDTGDDTLALAYELATPSGMTVDGIARYLTRRYPRPSSP